MLGRSNGSGGGNSSSGTIGIIENGNYNVSNYTSHNQPNVHIALKISYYKVNYSAG